MAAAQGDVMAAAQISVESSGGSVYRVVVTQGRNKTTHEVTVTPEDGYGQRDEKAIRGLAGLQPERNPQGDLLRLGQRVEVLEQRRAEPVQAGERQLHLRFDAGYLLEPEARRLASAVAQQGRLADARLTLHDENRALTPAHVVEQRIEQLALTGTAPERRRAVGGHGPSSLNGGK